MMRFLFAFFVSFFLALSANIQAQKPPRVALVLSGGGARGGAHIGVLRVLEGAGVPVDLIVGASYGALVGGLYAAGYSVRDIERVVSMVDWGELIDDRPNRQLLNANRKDIGDRRLIGLHLDSLEPRLPQGLFAGQKIQQLLDRLTIHASYRAENDFDRLPIAFRAVATDILTGETYVFKEGMLSTAIRASIAVPGLFTPVNMPHTLLVDGGIANNLPVDVALDEGVDLVIAVDSATPLRSHKDQVVDLLDVLDQAISFRIEDRKIENRKRAHVLITPDLKDFDAGKFNGASTLIPLGEAAADAHIDTIWALLDQLEDSKPRKDVRPELLPATFDPIQWTGIPLEVMVDSVRFEGLERYVPDDLHKTVRVPLMIPVSLDVLDQSVSALYATGLFETVSYGLHRHLKQTVLVFDVRETGRSELGVGLHYDQDFQLLALTEFLRRRILGPGSDFYVRGAIGKLKLAEVGIHVRPLRGPGVRLLGVYQWYDQDRLAFQNDARIGDYQESRYRTAVGLQRLFGNWGDIRLGYQFERVHVRKGLPILADTSENLPGMWGDLRVDTRDRAFLPSRGLHIATRFQWSHNGVRRSETAVSQTVPLRSDVAFTLVGAFGYVSSTAPIYEQIHVGGAGHFSMAAMRFPGLNRDALRVTRFASGGLTFHKRFDGLHLDALRGLTVGFLYRAGLVNDPLTPTRFNHWIHGFGMGLYLDRRLSGPLRLEVVGTNRGDINVYTSIGYAF